MFSNLAFLGWSSIVLNIFSTPPLVAPLSAGLFALQSLLRTKFFSPLPSFRMRVFSNVAPKDLYLRPYLGWVKMLLQLLMPLSSSNCYCWLEFWSLSSHWCSLCSGWVDMRTTKSWGTSDSMCCCLVFCVLIFSCFSWILILLTTLETYDAFVPFGVCTSSLNLFFRFWLLYESLELFWVCQPLMFGWWLEAALSFMLRAFLRLSAWMTLSSCCDKVMSRLY